MLIESPADARIQAEVDRSFLALRSSLKSSEYQTAELSGGHYRLALTSGLTTILNAADAIVSLRWTDSVFRFVLHRLRVGATIGTAFTAAQETSLDLVRVVNFSASDTGGTAITLANGNHKGPGMNASRIGDLRVADATALGAGTGTAEAYPLGKLVLPLGNALGASAGGSLFEVAPGVEHPIILTALQGLRIRIGLTQGAVGVVRFTFVLDWAEVPIGV